MVNNFLSHETIEKLRNSAANASVESCCPEVADAAVTPVGMDPAGSEALGWTNPVCNGCEYHDVHLRFNYPQDWCNFTNEAVSGLKKECSNYTKK